MNSLGLSTTRLYYQDSSLSESEARVTAVGSNSEENEKYIVTDQTIFHPQGGGQPSDQGSILIEGISLPVVRLEEVNDAIRHYYTGDVMIEEGTTVSLAIDIARRSLLAKSHSAGHLLEDAVRELYGDETIVAYKGRHDLSGSSVSFNRFKEFDLNKAKETIESHLNALIKSDLPLIQGSADEGRRWVKFGDHQSLPCGGTHVKSSEEIGYVQIRYVRKASDSNGNKNSGVQIGYDIKDI